MQCKDPRLQKSSILENYETTHAYVSNICMQQSNPREMMHGEPWITSYVEVDAWLIVGDTSSGWNSGVNEMCTRNEAHA